MKKQLFTLLTALMVVIGMKAQVTLIDPALDGGFENGTTFASNSWSVAQGALTTRVWQIGAGQTGFSGTASAFIGDNSTTVGSTTSSRTVHLFRSVSIPTGAENIILSFKYKQTIDDNTYDFLKVFLNGNTPVSATTQTLNNLVTIDPTSTNNYSVFTVVTVTVPNSFAGTTNNLIFSFTADGFSPHGYGAIDDVSLTYVLPTCASISALNNTTLTASTVNYTWTTNGVATAWDIYYGLNPLTVPNATTVPTATVSANSFSISGLNPTTPYTIYVRSNCSSLDQSFWVQSNFTTLNPPCVTPTSQATGLVFGGITNASISGTFTAATPTVSNYLIIRTLGTAPNTPTNGVTYTTGASAALGGTVVSVGSGTTFTSSTGIVGNTNYSYFIYSFNNTGCLGGPLYNTTTPLMGTLTTCPAKVTAVTTSSVTASSFNLAWTAPAGGSAAVINYSIEISSSSTFTTGNLVGSPFMVSAPTTSLIVTGLNPVAQYYYRVTADNGCNSGATTSANVTTAAIPVDLQTVSLITPTVNATGCYATTPIVVQIKNAGTSALDFSTNNATVYGAVTGINPQTFTTVVSTGTLAANATRNVTLTTSYNMSAVGVYSINAISILATPDANTSNDMMAQVTRTTLAGAPLPYSQDFPTTTAPAGWNTTGWTIASNHGLTTNGIYRNMWSSAATGTFSLLKLGTVVGNESFAFDYRVLNYNATYPGTVTVPSGSVAAWGNFKVQVSGDCGSTYTDLATIDNTTHTVTTQAWTNKAYSLAAFAGQNIIVRVVATWVSGDYFIDIDNINVASCFVPTAVVINTVTPNGTDASWTAPSLSTPASYIYEVRSSGAVGSGTTGLATTGTVTAPSTSVSVSGLTASTGYSVYVMSSCGVGSSSVWTPAKTFTTLCTPAVAPTAANSSQCGFGVSSASVTGGTSYVWYATATSTTALQTSTLTTYTTAIGSTTTFYVSNNNGTCLSPRVPVTTTVSTPELVMASATATALCPGSSSVLLSVNQATGTVYSFTWSASPSLGSGLTSPVVNQTVSVLPTTFGTYVYQVLASDGICTTTSSVTILSSNIPSIMANTSPTASCSGSNVILNAVDVSPGMISIGTNTTTTSSTGYPTAFGNYWYQTWQQYLYTASELKAMGLVAGNISSLAFKIAATPSPNSTLADYNVKIAVTSNTVLTAFTTAGLTNAFGPAPVNAVVGVNTINFTTPYNWDGNSNLIIDLRQTEFFGSGNATTFYSTTPNNSVLYAYSTSSDVNYWTSNPTPTSSSSRPNITFGGIVATSNPPISWQWNPGALAGNTVVVNPINTGTAAITLNYTVSATNTVTGCSNTATTSVLVNPLPSPVVATNATQCGIGIPTASVTGGTSYNWYASATSTVLLQSGAATNYTSAIGTTTSWFVTNFNGTCESTRRQVTQTVTVPDALTAMSSSSMVCPGGSYSLSAVKTGTMNTYSYTWNAMPSVGSGMTSTVTGANQFVMPTVAGNYNYIVTAIDGACTTTASVMVALNNAPAISASSNPTMICSGSNVMLDAQSIAAAAGTSTVGVQTSTDYLGGPYRGGSGSDYKAEWIFTAAELNAAGIQAGNITAISFSVPTGAAGNLVNYTLKMGNTALTTLGTTYASGLTTVLGPVSYAPVNGLNTHALTTPFNWDGVSNIIIDACNDGGAGSSVNTSMITAANNSIYSATSGACGLLTGGTSGKRPVIFFGAQVGSNVTSNMNFVWNPGAINTNTAMVNPVNTGTTAVTITYTATVTNTVTGCSNYTTVAVVVNPLPTMPLAINAIQCGLAVPTASVSGGTSYNWYASATATTALQMGAASHFTSVIGATTTWYVASFNGNCEGPRAMVTQSVIIPDAIMASASATAVCPNSMVNLMATNSGTVNTYTYSWMATPSVGSGMPTSVTGASASVMPSVSGIYNYVVTGVDAACTTTAAVSVIVNTVPSIVSSATPSMVCSGAVVNLNATTPVIGTGSIAIGTATTLTAGNTTEPTAFCNRYTGYRMQAVYTAAELTAAGLSAGNINSIAYDIATLGDDATNPLYTVKCGTTAASSFTNFVSNTGFTTVYPSATYTHSLGLNIIPFSTAYNWDGISNLVVEVTHDGVDGATSSQTYYTATTSNMIVYSNYSSTSGNPGTKRLNIVFNGQKIVQSSSDLNWVWNPGAINTNTAMVNPVNTGTSAITMVYTVSATNTLTGCSSSATNSVIVNPFPIVMATTASSVICANYTTTLSATGAITYSWMPAGGNIANASVTPSATTIYTVVGTTAGCSSTATVQITTNASPTIQVVSSSTSAVCPATSVTLTTSGVATTYTWSPAVSTNSMAVVTPTASSVYTVMAEDAGCVTTKTIAVAVNATTLNVVASNTAICLGTTSGVTILASGSAVSYTWSPVVTSNTTTILAVTPTVTTNYVITGANALGCETTKTITINVANTPTVMITASSSTICTGNSATLTANGASSYTWDPIVSTATNVVVSPTVVSIYSVTGEANGCSSTGVVTIAVNQLPIINTSATPAVICNGHSSTLSATTTATSYTWSNGANTISTVVTPTATSNYTLTVNDAICNASTVITVSVSACIGLEELSANGISIYPNPTTEILNIDVNTDLVNASTVNIYDALGKLVISENITNARTTIRTSNLDTGMYFVRIISNNREISVQKLIKQ